jgi:hypothetical protein
MARLLGEGGFVEEVRGPLLEAMHLCARALAIESRAPEPEKVEEILLPPLSGLWPERVAVFRSYLANGEAEWSAVASVLG